MRTVFAILTFVAFGWTTANAADSSSGDDPYWILLHEQAVIEELNLDDAQRKAFQEFMDGIDLRFFPLRNKSREDALAGYAALKAEIESQLETLLTPQQHERFNQILLRRIGTPSLLRDDVASRMRYTDQQRKRLQGILDDLQTKTSAIEKDWNKGGFREALEQRFRDAASDAEKQIHAMLRPEQEKILIKILGPEFDMTQLGHLSFKAPELVNTSEWLNGSPVSLEQHRGKVVVIHFYACGCINCIHNFPWYREWTERFRDKDVAIIGIHTPEVDSERRVENVRRSAAEEKLMFPILIDGKNENWNAWGNSMWPSVYVIDKQGYLRHFWAGELKWNGRDGEKFMRDGIEELLAEPLP